MKRVIGLFVLFAFSSPLFGQTQEEEKNKQVEIFFEHNGDTVDPDLSGNRDVLSNLTEFINELQADSLRRISKVEIVGYTSPEGGRSFNKTLGERRTAALYDYICSNTSVATSLIEKSSVGTDWEELEQRVADSKMEYADEVLEIIQNVPEETWERVNPNDRWLTLTDSRNKHLMDLRRGDPYRYMFKNIYPDLRRGSVVTVYFKSIAKPVVEEPEVVEVIEPTPEPTPTPEPKAEPVVTPIPMPLFALKTNLLFDVATLLNVELEVPIGDRWSVAGEWIFPWWTSCGNRRNDWQNGKSRRNTLEVLNGNIEGKYWFGDRSDRPVMTGWHLGLYAGAGKYDIERRAEGYQGEFFISAGLSGGYAHTINKSGNLRMEYSLGLGYLQTDYVHYHEHLGIDDEWHTIRQNSVSYSWIGPTRARVSLVWMLNRKAK